MDKIKGEDPGLSSHLWNICPKRGLLCFTLSHRGLLTHLFTFNRHLFLLIIIIVLKRCVHCRKLYKKKREKQNWNNTPYSYHQEITIINNLVYAFLIFMYVCVCVLSKWDIMLFYLLILLKILQFSMSLHFHRVYSWYIFKFHNLFPKCPLYFICSNHNSIHNHVLHLIVMFLKSLI